MGFTKSSIQVELIWATTPLVFAELQEAAEQERAAQEEHNQKLAEFSKLLAEADRKSVV